MALRRGASDKTEDRNQTVQRASDINGGRTAGRFGRRAAACVLACAALGAQAAPPAGTVIPNRAAATGQQGSVPFNAASNIVTLTVGTGPAIGKPFAATLEASRFFTTPAGTTVYARHVLTNAGTSPDTYTLSATDVTGDYTFASLALFADANDDGQPDSSTPIANPVVLAPGAALRFVAALSVPTSAPSRGLDHARIAVASVGGAVIAPNLDQVMAADRAVLDCATATKVLSRYEGPSPGGPVTVTLRYSACDKARARVVLTDRLPSGMRYVPGSARWVAASTVALTDGIVGDDLQGEGASRIAYDYNVTIAGAVTATVTNIPAGGAGSVLFDVEIDAGIAVGTSIANTAQYAFSDTAGRYGGQSSTNTVSYLVNGRVDVELVGQRLPTAAPGATIAFTNVLTNRGTATETFDITLSGSTFPAGTVLALFKADGTTPLADSDGNGTPDTGPVAPGASYNIVVRARIPETAASAAYKVTKTARAASAPMRFAAADDAVDTVSARCALALDPDNQSTIGRGQHVTYTHFLSNRGNCAETVTAILDYLGDSSAGWTSSAFVDNRGGGAGSIPGALDASDARILRGWNATLQPGETLRILVDVLSPEAQKAARAKAAIESNLTTLVLTSSGTGTLTVKDTTVVDDKDEPAQPDNAIRNFTDATYSVPTLWGVVGGELWLRAHATSCNAVADVIESRTVVITGPNGEREELTAVETGANTGVFTLPRLAVRAPPVVAGDGVLQGRPNDVYEIELVGCGRRIATVVTLMEPASFVFDSRTNEAVAGARVSLVAAAGGRCTATAVNLNGASNPVITGSTGRFAFPAMAAGAYCLAVQAPNGYRFASRVAWPLLPQGRNLHATGPTRGGSYGDPFALAAAGLVVIDIPLDGAAQDGLFVQKAASRQVAEVGEHVDYTVRVRNSTGNVLDRAPVVLTDDLPAGFAFVAGSARRDGQAIADPVGGMGPRLTLALGTMDRNAEVVITYRVRIGPGALQGDGVNRVQASYAAGATPTLSNIATAKVHATGGVFTEKGFILGKVFMDCNANGVQDALERGVPGVRLVLEDGTFVFTDGGGKFSFYGISNRTHVVKADRTTLPAGARLAAISARHLGDGGSRIVDLKSGEMHRADFAIAGCAPGVVEEVRARAEKIARADEAGAMAGAQLATEARVVTDPRALPASGLVTLATPTDSVLAGANGAPAAARANGSAPAVPAYAASAVRVVELEKLVPDLDNTLGFIGLADGDTLPYAQTAIRVKGRAGAAFELSVNGAVVSESRVGKRSVLQDKQVQAWEYIGVDLAPGENTVTVVQRDPFGNERGRQSLRLVAPGELAKIVLSLPAGAVADGRSTAKIVVTLTDARGVPVTARTPVTLEASRGTWSAQDLDPSEPGTQVMVEGGRAELALAAPIEPGESLVIATTGKLKAEGKLDFLPELRSLIAAGVLEGAINLRKIDSRALVTARAQDGFEQDLRHLSRSSGNGEREAGARAAFFLKGKIRGEYLLTAAYDSDKDTRERLFRDIQPDEFYPVYGDSAVRGYDAQSTARLYLRVDHEKSYLLYGDFTTQGDVNVRRLSAYSRSLTGLRQHYENGRVKANAFASRDSTRQKIDEIPANGTSGPYTLSSPAGLVNSEKVEILTRERNRPSLVIATVAQARFYDYEMEPLTGRLLFKAPVPSVDRDLNPVSIRVTYEVDQGGEQFWVFGGDAEVKVTDNIVLGASVAEDRNPADPFKLRGAHAVIRLGERTTITGEFARTEHEATVGQGDGARLHVKHDGDALKAEAFVARTDPTFDNPGAYLGQGRGESGARASYKVDDKTSIKAEALRTEDTANHNTRDGYMLSIERSFDNRVKAEIGVRHAREAGGAAIPPTASTPGSAGTTPNEVTSVRLRLTGPVPFVKDASIYGEVEVDTQDAERKVVAIGGDYLLPDRGKLYLRHELISSLTGPYGLNEQQRQNATILGVDTEYMKDARLFSEYRIREALSGGDAEAAIGLRNLWTIADGLRLGTTFEHVHAFSGNGQNENIAAAFALEYTGAKTWKGSTRLEVRDGATNQSLLHTLGFASRLAREWTFLGRNTLSIQRNKGGGRDGGEHLIERLQAGIAFRDADHDRVNALARVEHREERDDTQVGIDLRRAVELISLHADWKLSRPFLVSGHYAAKWTRENSLGIATRYRAQLAAGRATWEFAPRWDIGIAASALFGEHARSRQYAFGVELGYLVATNLWVSAGYNISGYRDDDLAANEYTQKGPYVRLRYKFDEALFGAAGEGAR